MKKIIFLVLGSFLSFVTLAQNPNDFIMTYEVNDDIGLYVQYPISGGDFTIDLGDGNMLTDDDVNISGIHHTYAAPGTYTITVSGDFNRIRYAGAASYNMDEKVKSIEQWGTSQWITMEQAFYGCQILEVNATDIPDLSLVKDMSEMFREAHIFNSPVNEWDVSNVTNMYRLFRDATSFNQQLDSWDVSNVTNMSEMFGRANAFNQNIDDWDVSNVTEMVDMFGFFPEDEPSFNQPLNNWDVSSVTDMYWMFRNNEVFNQPLNNWDVSSVIEMGSMFLNASSFNQPIDDWDISNVDSMRSMFEGASSFNQALNGWDVSNATSIRQMFSNATSFNQPLDNWDISNVTSINGLFHYATSFNQDISVWDFDSVIDLNTPSYGETFLSFTAMDTTNYDSLLLKFAQSGLQNKIMIAEEVFYCDAAVRSYLIDEAGWWFVDDALSSDCTEYSLSGTILYDENNNGCDSEDVNADGFIINAVSNGFNYGTTSVNGAYSINITSGTYDVSVNLPSYFDVTPEISTITFEETNVTEVVNFCLTANQTINDLNITLVPTDVARPGFEASYSLIIQNTGTEDIDMVNAVVQFNDALETFVLSEPAPDVVTNNQLEFAIPSIGSLQTVAIPITMQIATPPTVMGGDILNYVVSITPDSDDNTPENNTYIYDQVVVNSFDPNDKLVLQGDEILIEQIDDYLDYVIRFQNTGTANATFVTIEDVLEEKLDWDTLQMIGASHSYEVNITNGNEIEFYFDDIDLPYEDADEEGSQGYVAFRIKPKSDVELGDLIIGSAAIYFDYNPPIITNTVETLIVEPDAFPVAICQNLQVELDETGIVLLDAEAIGLNSTDDNGIESYAVSPSSFDCSNLGFNDVALTITDTGGNESMCTATIEVLDMIAPTVLCPDAITVEIFEDEQYILPDYVLNEDVSATDNCTNPLIAYEQIPSPGTLLSGGDQLITFEFTDEAGNIAQCAFTLTVDVLLGVSENEIIDEDFSIFPNPTEDQLSFKSENREINSIEIYDISGKKILALYDVNSFNTAINFSKLSKGMYLAVINEASTFKFVKK